MSSSSQVKYLRLEPDSDLPPLDDTALFKAVLIVEADTSQPWQWELARWIARTNCRNVMTWGVESDSWREAIEDANLEVFNYEDIPEAQLIMTTSHDDEDLPEVFWYCKHRARHPVHELPLTVLLHVSKELRKSEYEAEYADA